MHVYIISMHVSFGFLFSDVKPQVQPRVHPIQNLHRSANRWRDMCGRIYSGQDLNPPRAKHFHAFIIQESGTGPAQGEGSQGDGPEPTKERGLTSSMS